jgi:hypothetical protein
MDDKALEGLIVLGILLIIVIIGSLLPEKKRDTSLDKYNEILDDYLVAKIRLQTLKNMQEKSGNNYSKSILKQKKLIERLKRQIEKEKIRINFKSGFKSVSNDEKIKILESSLLNRLIARTKDSMSSRISKKEFFFLVTRESTKYYLGCSIEDFIKHLESYFTKDIDWTNYEKWHLDHIIPISSAENIDEFNALQHYKNIQPLYENLNIKKSNKFNEKEKIEYLE